MAKVDWPSRGNPGKGAQARAKRRVDFEPFHADSVTAILPNNGVYYRDFLVEGDEDRISLEQKMFSKGKTNTRLLKSGDPFAPSGQIGRETSKSKQFHRDVDTLPHREGEKVITHYTAEGDILYTSERKATTFKRRNLPVKIFSPEEIQRENEKRK